MNSIVVALLFALVAAVSCDTEAEYKAAFENFKATYGKTYLPSEELHRYNVFKTNLDFIKNWDETEKGFKVKMNKFGDLSSTEFASLYLGTTITKTYKPLRSKVDVSSLPATVDWRQKGAVTGVKNQGQCGSCWSFSTTGSVEGAWFLAEKKLVSLSEQNLMDCSTAQGNQGCNGGLMDQAFQYIIDNKGIDTEASYPYTAQDGTCHYTTSNKGATISSFKDVTSGDENALQTAVAQQPVSVAIDASQSSFQFYTSGVYYEPACSSTSLDHGVLAVGYGTDSGSDYWLVKNSWGTDWGNQGYIEMSRNKNNNCGIATAASFPII